MEIIIFYHFSLDIFISDYLNNEGWFLIPTQIYNGNNVDPRVTITIYSISKSHLLLCLTTGKTQFWQYLQCTYYLEQYRTN